MNSLFTPAINPLLSPHLRKFDCGAELGPRSQRPFCLPIIIAPPGLQEEFRFGVGVGRGEALRVGYLLSRPRWTRKPARAVRGWPSVVVGVFEFSMERLKRFSPAAKISICGMRGRLPKLCET